MSERRFQPDESPAAGSTPLAGGVAGAAPSVGQSDTEPPVEITPTPATSAAPLAQPEAALRLGETLSFAVKQGKYHPVIVFGTTSSGKTSLLLSLFAAMRDGRLKTDLSLCDPLLGNDDALSRDLHNEARHTFENKTEQFILGLRPDATAYPRPFFIPVELEPGDSKPAVRLAILEGKGEWYSANEQAIRSAQTDARIYPELKGTLERFISTFEGPITFIYLAPYTQRAPNGDLHSKKDADSIKLAGLAISGMIDSYRKVRGVHAPLDWHQLIVSKWDEHSARADDPSDVARHDQAEVEQFLVEQYGAPFSKWTKLPKPRRRARGYTAGIMNEEGVVCFSRGHSLRETLDGYPAGLWTRLYRNALEAAGEPDQSPFPQPPSPSPFKVALDRVLRVFTGH